MHPAELLMAIVEDVVNDELRSCRPSIWDDRPFDTPSDIGYRIAHQVERELFAHGLRIAHAPLPVAGG